MSRTKNARPINPFRQFLARTAVLVLLLGGTALFGSLTQVTCQRIEGRVDCQVAQGIELPWSGSWLGFWQQGVTDLRDATWARQSEGRSATQPGTTTQPYDVLVLNGNERLEVGWTGASAPINAFLAAPTRTEMKALQPPDPRGWLVSRALSLLAILVVLDSLIVLGLGNKRIASWLGPPPDPAAPLPDTPLAKIGPVILILTVLGLFLFFAVGYRFVGPLAEHKVAALHEAVAQGDLQALDRVLARGVSVHAIDPATGRIALHLGARTTAVLERLLAHDADPNAFDHDNKTPLHEAASYGDHAGVVALLERGADPDCMDNSGWTPLRHAADAGNLEAVRSLLAAGSDPQRQGPHGWTPLHSAAAANNAGIVAHLLAAGADPLVRNENGHIPRDLAHFPEVSDLLAN